MPIKRHHALITINGVRSLLKSNQEFHCRYDLVEMTNGHPSYQCIYIIDGKENVLIRSILTDRGVQPRVFKFWPGFWRHHREYGDGSDILVDKDYIITTTVRGLNELPPAEDEEKNG